jgi:broad specificity phosphatase PhoE
MRLIIVRHGETDWTLAGRYTGSTDVPLTAHGRREATSLALLLEHLLGGHDPVVVSSPRQRATATAALALPQCQVVIDPLVSEYDYGDYEGLTSEQILLRAPGWDIWSDGCPHGESTPDVGARADVFLRTTVENCRAPLIVATHGHFSRILAARALGLAAEYGRLFASVPGSVSLIEDHHGERCVGLWNADTALVEHLGNPRRDRNEQMTAPLLAAGGELP